MAGTISPLFRQIEEIFHPESVAIVGVPRGMKMGKLFLVALKDQGFRGSIFPVNPSIEDIDGMRVYPSVKDIPGRVDMAIVSVPAERALEVVRECAQKRVKVVVMFTAGFGETGTPAGMAAEMELKDLARQSGMRIIGPNCMGIYAPSSGLSFFPELPKEPGPIGMVSQSGSLGNILGRMAKQRGLRFSKVVSIGNQCDLTASEFLSYLALDGETGLIGIYLEGVRDGRTFFQALRTACERKPVILWKVGLTPEGQRAARSHTASMGGSEDIWGAVARQAGATRVNGFEEFVDTLMGFAFIPEPLGPRVAIISGPGGLAVSAAEACGKEGLILATLSRGTRKRLGEVLPSTGTSTANPVDVGLTASFDISIYVEGARLVAEDPAVDAIVMIGMGISQEDNRKYAEAIIELREKTKKPFLIVNIPGFDPEMGTPFLEAKVPFFESSERALRVYRLLWDDFSRRKSRSSTSSFLNRG